MKLNKILIPVIVLAIITIGLYVFIEIRTRKQVEFQCGIETVGRPDVCRLTLPEDWDCPEWNSTLSACEECGYHIRPYGGKTVKVREYKTNEIVRGENVHVEVYIYRFKVIAMLIGFGDNSRSQGPLPANYFNGN